MRLHRRLGNNIVRGVLRSPLHGVLSRSLALVRYEGRRSGRAIELPVMYARDKDVVYVLSGHASDKVWWRSFVTPRPATLHIAGKELDAIGAVLAEGQDLDRALDHYRHRWPKVAVADGTVIVAFTTGTGVPDDEPLNALEASA